jgi:hypothetical protein
MPTPSRRDGSEPDGCFNLWFGVIAAVSVVVMGVFVWAVIKLVIHFTA